jgi:hypothetical protein
MCGAIATARAVTGRTVSCKTLLACGNFGAYLTLCHI